MLNRNVTGVSNTIACVCRRGVEAGFSQLVNGRVCLCTLVGYLDVGPGVGTRHMEIPEEIQMYRSDSTHMYYRTVYELHMCISLSYRFKSGLTAFVFAFNMFFLSQKRQEDDVNNTETSNLDGFEQILYWASEGTARSVEDETRNGHRNEKRNPNRNQKTIVLGLFLLENLKRAIKR